MERAAEKHRSTPRIYAMSQTGTAMTVLFIVMGFVLGLLIQLLKSLINYPLSVEYWDMTAITFSVTFLTTSLLGGLSDKSEKIYWVSYPDEYLIKRQPNFLTLSTISYICLGIQVVIALAIPDSFVLKESLFISYFILAIATVIILSYRFTSVYFDREKYLDKIRKIFEEKIQENTDESEKWIRDSVVGLYGNTLYCIEERSSEKVVENLVLLVANYDNSACREYAEKIVRAIEELNGIIMPEVMVLLDNDERIRNEAAENYKLFLDDITELMFREEISYSTWKSCAFKLEQRYQDVMADFREKYEIVYKKKCENSEKTPEESDELERQFVDIFNYCDSQVTVFNKNNDTEFTFDIVRFMLNIRGYCTEDITSPIDDLYLSSWSLLKIIPHFEAMMDNIKIAVDKRQSQGIITNSEFILDYIVNSEDYYPEVGGDERFYRIKIKHDKLLWSVTSKMDELLTGICESSPDNFKFFLTTIFKAGLESQYFEYCFMHSASSQLRRMTLEYDRTETRKAIINIIDSLTSKFHEENERENTDNTYGGSINICRYEILLGRLASIWSDMIGRTCYDDFAGRIIGKTHFVNKYTRLTEFPEYYYSDEDGDFYITTETVTLNSLVRLYELYNSAPDGLKKFARDLQLHCDYETEENRPSRDETEFFIDYVMDQVTAEGENNPLENPENPNIPKAILRITVNAILGISDGIDVNLTDGPAHRFLQYVKANDELKTEMAIILDECQELLEKFEKEYEETLRVEEDLDERDRLEKVYSDIAGSYRETLGQIEKIMKAAEDNEGK